MCSSNRLCMMLFTNNKVGSSSRVYDDVRGRLQLAPRITVEGIAVSSPNQSLLFSKTLSSLW